MDECKPLEVGEVHHRRGGPSHGRAVQVDPIKPTLNPPRSERLNLKHDGPLSSSAFKLNLRRYSMEARVLKVGRCRLTLSNPC